MGKARLTVAICVLALSLLALSPGGVRADSVAGTLPGAVEVIGDDAPSDLRIKVGWADAEGREFDFRDYFGDAYRHHALSSASGLAFVLGVEATLDHYGRVAQSILWEALRRGEQLEAIRGGDPRVSIVVPPSVILIGRFTPLFRAVQLVGAAVLAYPALEAFVGYVSAHRAVFVEDMTGNKVTPGWLCRNPRDPEHGDFHQTSRVSCPLIADKPTNSPPAIWAITGGGADQVTLDGSVCSCVSERLVMAGPGDDRVAGTDGPDTLVGDDGKDLIKAAAGDDLVYGGSATEQPATGRDDDRLLGGDGRDVIFGQEGNDLIFGGRDDDVRDITLIGPDTGITIQTETLGLDGGPGDDVIVGGQGADRMLGAAGRDTLISKEAAFASGAIEVADERVDCGPGVASGPQFRLASPADPVTGCDAVFGYPISWSGLFEWDGQQPWPWL